MKSSRLLLAAITIGSLSIASTAKADGSFRPASFKVKFYEVGVQNSATGQRSVVFQDSNGQEVDIANPNTGGLPILQRPSNGVYDQVYVLVGNSVKINGTDGNGCYTRSGASASTTNYQYAVTTNNPALRGEATTTENGFGAVGNNGPVTPSLAGSVNGAVVNLSLGLVSASNPIIGGGGAINRYLYTGDLGQRYRITDATTGSIAFHFDTSQAVTFQGGCTSATYGLTKVNLAVSTNAETAN